MNVSDAVPPLPDRSLNGLGRVRLAQSPAQETGRHWVKRWWMLGALAGTLGTFGLSSTPTAFAEEGKLRATGGIRSDLPALRRDSTAADLTLDRKGERIAEALAAYAQGIAAEDNADIERALQAYRRSLELDPSNTELAAKVGLELARRDQIPEGINILKDAEKAMPKDAIPPLCLSQIYGKFLNKPQLAERYAQKAISLDPGNFSTYLALVDLYATTGQGKKASQVLDRAYRAKTESPEFWLQLAEVTIRMARYQQAELSAEARGRLETMFTKALKPSTDGSLARRLMKGGDLYGLIREPTKAIDLYQQALKAEGGLDADDRVALRNKLAQMQITEKQPQEAIATLEALLKEAPNRYETYELLGELYEGNNQIEKAVGCFQQALKMDPTEPIRFIRVAQLQMQINRRADAVATLTEAKDRFISNPRVTYPLALAQASAGDYQRSLASFAQALEEAETIDRSLLTAEFYLHYGKTAQRGGDVATSARMFRKSIELDPANAADAYNNLGYMWAEQGIYLPEALELIKRALALDPENPAYLDSLGWCYFRLGQYPEALDALERAVERMEPEEAVVLEHLGDVYHAMGEKEKAREQWQKALSLNPENTALQKKTGQPTQTAQP